MAERTNSQAATRSRAITQQRVERRQARRRRRMLRPRPFPEVVACTTADLVIRTRRASATSRVKTWMIAARTRMTCVPVELTPICRLVLRLVRLRQPSSNARRSVAAIRDRRVVACRAACKVAVRTFIRIAECPLPCRRLPLL